MSAALLKQKKNLAQQSDRFFAENAEEVQCVTPDMVWWSPCVPCTCPGAMVLELYTVEGLLGVGGEFYLASKQEQI